MPLLFSRVTRRAVKLLALGLFTASTVAAALTESFSVLIVARALPAFLHPVYVSMAFSVAKASVRREDAPKTASSVFIGVSAGMVLGVLAGLTNNTGQYMISEAAPKAPDFANRLFLTSANLGMTVGTAICGLFITAFGTRYSLISALLFLGAGFGFVFVRNLHLNLKKS